MTPAGSAMQELMSQFASFGSAVANWRVEELQHAWLRIANNGASNTVEADISRLSLLSHDEILHSVLQFDVRQTWLLQQHRSPTHEQSADAQPIEYMDASEFVHQTATAAHSMSPQSTLHA
ncbi:hypothetical protein IWW56_003222 [Coemansia sp. RSA 2131]|nr:hypothetical protein IWW56_003222 [Coemansia sp. RSA 2131]